MARPRKRVPPPYPVRDLSYVTASGGRTRSHRYAREMMIFLWPVLVTIIGQAIIYLAVIAQSGRIVAPNALHVILVLALVPVLSAALLTAFRRSEAPIIVASVISLSIFSGAVALLSGLRLPLSYQGLSWCLPLVVVVMSYANLRFHRTLDTRVALLPFARAKSVATQLGGVPVLCGPDADIDDLQIVLIDPLNPPGEAWSSLLARCYLGGIDIMPWTRYLEVHSGRLDIESFDISHLSYSPSQLLYARAKRILDLVAVVLTLPLTLVLSALVALYIFSRDGGPVLFVQIRRGYGGRRFRMYKFRTMFKGTRGGATRVGDSRIIPGCRFVRRLRLDELPQIYNILKRDMSLIGPRPVAEYISRSSEIAEPKYALRSLVLPGLTGWAQVMSGYASTTAEEINKLSYDLYYIKHMSLDLDLLVLSKTIKTVVFGSGAR